MGFRIVTELFAVSGYQVHLGVLYCLQIVACRMESYRLAEGNSGGIRREFQGNSGPKKGIQGKRALKSTKKQRVFAYSGVCARPRVPII